ncbi:FliO/MopB family protein [Tepidiphilus thermophilus]|uniref:Flagellar biosynthesis protein, FliO n=1 Tax=Tepidiphilus thermophilus TaxID=876478 RepID=A0A0K6IVH4_9PROT|nr:flagellar biosynthetic protein FliO [Tepidiphilus thermophilus]CUB07111.1 Flagellar biosynthesis protein, FliO [Tepidiphilus thermophilus]
MTTDWIHPITQLALGLGITAIALWAAFATLRRLQRRQGGRVGLSILGAIAVGTRERVVLLEAEGVRLLLGVTPNTITLLQRLPDHPSSFADRLAAAIDEGNTDPPSPPPAAKQGANQ